MMKNLSDIEQFKGAKGGNEPEDKMTTIDLNERFNKSFHYVRFLIIILGGLAIGIMFFARLSITVAMLSMVNHTHLYILEHPNATIEGPLDPAKNGDFNWTNDIQQFIISGYMIAYTIPQVYTARLTSKYGIRNSISLSLLCISLSCSLAPVLTYWGWGWMLALRLLNGLGASAMLPGMINAIEKWVPYQDSANGLALMQFVQTILYALTPLISGSLTSIHWKWALYAPGILSGAFAIIWYVLSRDSPDECPFISQRELNLIKGIGDTNDDNIERKRPPRTDLPWYFMFKVKSFYFFVLAWVLFNTAWNAFLYLMPTYFNGVLELSVIDIGFYNFIVQIGVQFSMLWPNPAVGFLQRRFNLSLSVARTFVVFVYTFMSVMTWFYLATFHNHQIIVIFLNRFFNGTNDTVITSTLMSQFGRDGLSGAAYSMMNTIGNLSSVPFCWFLGRLLDLTGESLGCWSGIFVAMGVINIGLFLVYSIFIKSEPVAIPLRESKEEGHEQKKAHV